MYLSRAGMPRRIRLTDMNPPPCGIHDPSGSRPRAGNASQLPRARSPHPANRTQPQRVVRTPQVVPDGAARMRPVQDSSAITVITSRCLGPSLPGGPVPVDSSSCRSALIGASVARLPHALRRLSHETDSVSSPYDKEGSSIARPPDRTAFPRVMLLRPPRVRHRTRSATVTP